VSARSNESKQHPTEDGLLQFRLHPAQLEVFQSPKRFVIVTAGRRFGKTYLAATRAMTKAFDPRNVLRKPVFIVAPIATQAKLLYWQLILDKLGGVGGQYIENAHINDGHIFLRNGVMIGVKGSDRPDTLRGVGIWHVELDEYADMKPETWESILRPALADVKGTAGFIGTPKGRNHFWDLIQDAKKDENIPHWDVFHYVSTANPFLDKGEIELAKNTMSSATFRQEFMASFEAGGTDSFKEEWFKYSDEEPFETDAKGEKKVLPGDWYVVVDLAGFAEVQKASGYRQKRLDYTAIAVVKILEDERWYVRDLYIGRWGIEEVATRIIDAVDSCKTLNLGIEKGALFQAVAPYLQHAAAKRNLPLSIEPLSHENKSKNERIGWALQGRMEHGKILFRSGSHMREVKDQFLNFPSALVHDDALDCLAYVPQLAASRVFQRFAHVSDEDYWEPLDADVGY
jgi:predicted phage terminase large subunit-like protein